MTREKKSSCKVLVTLLVKVCSGLQDETQDGHINSQGVGMWTSTQKRNFKEKFLSRNRRQQLLCAVYSLLNKHFPKKQVFTAEKLSRINE